MKSCSKAYPGRPYTQHMQGQVSNTERGLNPALMTQRRVMRAPLWWVSLKWCKFASSGAENESVDEVLRIFPENRESRPLAVIRIAGFDGLIAKL